LPTSVNVVLSNGVSLSQQVMYESLPYFCKQCRVLGHSVSTCYKGTSSKRKKHAHEAPTCFGNSSPSAETAVVEKQQPYSAVPFVDPPLNRMFTEAITAGETRPKSLGCKRTKIALLFFPSLYVGSLLLC